MMVTQESNQKSYKQEFSPKGSVLNQLILSYLLCIAMVLLKGELNTS